MLTIQNLSYSHPNKNTLFTNLSMTVNQSDKIALIGNNGVGKSTLLKLIAKDLKPDEGQYEYIKQLKTDVQLDLAQYSCCTSLQDCKDRIIALAYENLDEAEEYPEDGRIVIHFGDYIDDVESMLARRDMRMKFV